VQRALTILVHPPQTQRNAVRHILRHAGFRVEEAGSGREALRAARGAADLILLHVEWPDSSAFELCRRIKADAATALIPVVCIAAGAVSEETKMRSLDSGVDAFFSHPLDAAELVKTVRTLLHTSELWRDLRPLASNQPAPTILCIDDSEASLEVRQTFLEHFGYRVLSASSGGRGLQIFSGQAVDAVVLDYNMPDMSGEEVALNLRRLNSRIPIVLLSGYPDDIPRPLIETLDAFVAKGQPPNVLLEILKELLPPAPVRAEARPPQATGKKPAERTGPLPSPRRERRSKS
jgi:CheY-like chemotaxis protein